MIYFNNDQLITGYIKQLLASFNLPKRKNGQWINFSDTDYFYNKKILNKTKTFIIKNNIYDSYTHNYLGDYLRFMRDYTGINLMSLYNCFSNQVPTNLQFNFLIESKKETEEQLVSFNSSDKNHKIYMLPVKFGQLYTIAIDSSMPVEFFCGIYNKYLVQNDDLAATTYTKCGTMSFAKPILFDILTSLPDRLINTTLAAEDDLKLFIKLPISNKSSITILEGDYHSHNDVYFTADKTVLDDETQSTGYVSLDAPTADGRRQNRTVINFEQDIVVATPDLEKTNLTLISPAQLLMLNTGTSYPFSLTLISYLLENNITPADQLPDNVKRVQIALKKYLEASYSTGYVAAHPIANDGVWSNELRYLIYDSMQPKLRQAKDSSLPLLCRNNYDKSFNTFMDLLGYVDGNVEHLVPYLENIDIYPEG